MSKLAVEMLEIGVYYKRVRQERGYTLADVANSSDYLDKSQLSRFESGENMLSADRFLAAINGLNMTVTEFFALRSVEPSHYGIFSKKIMSYVMVNDITGLKGLIKPKARMKMDKIFNILVKSAILDISRENLVTNAEKKFLETYLLTIPYWTFFDVNIFGMCLEILDEEEVYDLGQRAFGENKVQELLEKQPVLPNDIEWHLIGHLQTNKVKYIAGFISMIESIDSEKLLKEVDKEALKNNRKINVLLQVKIAKEETKFGLTVDETKDIFNKYLNGNYPNIEIKGLMGMASFVDDETQIREEFSVLKNLFDEFSQLKPLETLSMGMSGDFPLAIDCGSNSVRVGSAIFGERNY